MKSLSGAKILQELSFGVINNLYACSRNGRKPKYRLVCGKLIKRDNQRYRLFGKTEHVCALCGQKATHCILTVDNQVSYIIEIGFIKDKSFIPLTVDHIVPLSQNGSRRSLDNQQLLCHPCNSKHKNNKDRLKQNGPKYKGWFVVGERSFNMQKYNNGEFTNVTHLTLNNPPPCAEPIWIDYVTGEVPTFVKVTQ